MTRCWHAGDDETNRHSVRSYYLQTPAEKDRWQSFVQLQTSLIHKTFCILSSLQDARVHAFLLLSSPWGAHKLRYRTQFTDCLPRHPGTTVKVAYEHTHVYKQKYTNAAVTSFLVKPSRTKVSIEETKTHKSSCIFRLELFSLATKNWTACTSFSVQDAGF